METLNQHIQTRPDKAVPMSTQNVRRRRQPRGAKNEQPVSRQQVVAIARGLLTPNMEVKYYVSNYLANVDYNGVISSVSSVPQGDTDVSRDGDRIMPLTFELRGTWAVADSFNVCRTILFRWNNDTTPAVTDILDTTFIATGQAPVAPFTHDTRQMYTVLMDQTVFLHTYKIIDGLTWPKFKLPRVPIQYLAASTTGSNKLYLLLISDSAASAHPGANIVHKLTFTDA